MQRVGRVIGTLSAVRTLFRPPPLQTFCFTRTLLQRHVSFTHKVMSYGSIERGVLYTQDYRMFITDSEGHAISPFHDIPLVSNEEKKIFNMVVEIPRWTNSKMEICKEEKLNPIKQDVKKGKVRFVKNCFPHHGYIWNYGALPQTWEDVDHTDPQTGTKGDNDPLDVCEIGSKVQQRGSVIQVKVLGIMCLIDEGETDWKLLCIDVNDPLAEEMNDVDDIDRLMPGFIKATYEWFKIYKIPDGKPENKFAFEGEAKNRAFALEVIEGCHQQWQKLVGEDPECSRGQVCCENMNVAGSPFKLQSGDSKQIVEQSSHVGPAAALPDDVDKWYYVNTITPSSAL